MEAKATNQRCIVVFLAYVFIFLRADNICIIIAVYIGLVTIIHANLCRCGELSFRFFWCWKLRESVGHFPLKSVLAYTIVNSIFKWDRSKCSVTLRAGEGKRGNFGTDMSESAGGWGGRETLIVNHLESYSVSGKECCPEHCCGVAGSVQECLLALALHFERLRCTQ